MSSYEKLRLGNIRRNEEFMASLGLDSVKAEITTSVKTNITTKHTRRVVGVKRQATEPVRRSSRHTESKELDAIENLRREGRGEEADAKQKEFDEIKRKKLEGDYVYNLTLSDEARRADTRLPSDPISFYPARNISDDLDEKASLTWGSSFFNNLKSIVATSSSLSFASTPKASSVDYIKGLKALTIDERDCAKIVESRIVSILLHPCTSKVLCFAGDKIENKIACYFSDASIYIFDRTSSD